MKDVETKDLLMYEMPTVAEFIAIGWIQDIFAKYLAWKVKKKIARYRMRVKRDKYFKALLKSND